MGSNNVIVINASGGRDTVLSTPIPVGQGPTGIVLNAVGANAGSATLAYVLNRFDATISVLSLAATNPTQAEVQRTALAKPVWSLASYVVKATGSDKLAFQATGNHPTYGALLDAAALDGNIDGNWPDGSLVITGDTAAQDYWEADLGAVDTVQTVNLFNRTDCCATRLNNFYVLVSATSMDGQSLAQLLANPAVSAQYVGNTGFVAGNEPQLYAVGMGGAQGRYVRVQLAGTNQLQLAEVAVMGWPAGAKSTARTGRFILTGARRYRRAAPAARHRGTGADSEAHHGR
jgi:hypothetical protein